MLDELEIRYTKEEKLLNELKLLRTLAMPMMHHANGTYNKEYRHKVNKVYPSYEQASKLLKDYFAGTSMVNGL
jgi:hypothetical protein